MGVLERCAEFLGFREDSAYPSWFSGWWPLAWAAFVPINFLLVGIYLGYRNEGFCLASLFWSVMGAFFELFLIWKAFSLAMGRLFPKAREPPKSAPKPYVEPGAPVRTYVEQEPPVPVLKVLSGPPVVPRVALKDKILLGLKEGAATATMLGKRMDCPKHAALQFLQPLVAHSQG